jgi:hypothetical protein
MQELAGATVNSTRSYASVRLPGSAHRIVSSGTPWLGCDPQFQGECSAAVRAFRLVCFAMLALFVAPLRALSADEPAQPATPQQTFTGHASARNVVLRAVSRQILTWKDSVRSFHAAKPGRTKRAVDDPKREALYLNVERSHGPPAINPCCDPGHCVNSAAPANTAFLPHCPAALHKFSDRIPAAPSASFSVFSVACRGGLLRAHSRVTLPARLVLFVPSPFKTNSLEGDNCHVCC